MFWNIVFAIASYAFQLLLAPKPKNAVAKTLSDFQAPTAEEGREIPPVFGTVDIAAPNCTWYGDLGKDAIKGARRYGLFGPRQVIGYKYSLGMQLGLCHGPADAIKSIRVGGKVAWTGSSAGGRITINKSNLFGGDQSEGGIKGDVDICMGAPDQLQNDYLVSQLGSTISAFRGVVTVVLRRVYLGTSNYIKPWEFRVQRILKRSDGSAQWYPEKAAIEGEAETIDSAFYFALDLTNGFLGVFEIQLTLNGGLDFLKADTEHKHDIRIVAFAGTVVKSIQRRKCTSTGYDELKDWLAGLTNVGHAGDADFNVGVSQASAFFSGAGSKRRVVIVMSGDSCVAGSPAAAKATLDAIGDVDVHGFLLGFSLNSPNMNVFDNTPEDDQVDGDCPVYLSNPVALNGALSKSPIINMDMNPAHIIRECLTDTTWGMGYHETDIDDASFTACADTFYAERFGLSLPWYQEEEIEQFVSNILRHVDAYLYGSRATGKFVLKAIRDDYDIDLIPVLTEDGILEFTEIKRRQPSEATSSVLVKYYNRQRRKTGAHRVTNTAQAMQTTGNVPPKTNEYEAINRQDLALRVGTRDVIALGSGLISGRVIVKPRDDLNPGDPFRIVSARHKLTGEVMRVISLRFGDGRDNKMGINLFQDVFKLSASVITDDGTSGGGWEPPTSEPLPVSPRLVHEMPYREARQMVGVADLEAMLASDADAGLIQIAGSKPNADATNALIEVDAGTGFA
ncbi:MAG: hypothetical protein E5V63_14865, partial [Mesorhizobium sp.]